MSACQGTHPYRHVRSQKLCNLLCTTASDAQRQHVQVADRLVFQRGSKTAWRSAVLRMKAQQLAQSGQWRRPPLSAFALSLRGRAIVPAPKRPVTIPAQRPTLTVNGCMDIGSLASRRHALQNTTQADGLEADQTGAQLSSFPATSGTLRKDLGDELVLSVGGHINRPFGHVAGWDTVRFLSSICCCTQ